MKDIHEGDTIDIERPDGKDTYVVDGTIIVDPSNVSVLNPGEKSTLTLVTCYPFYFVGNDASEPFVWRGVVEGSLPICYGPGQEVQTSGAATKGEQT